ncbi:femAB family protein [Clostridioides difficile CD160]|nr:femAB family protein [Clostridioides difficile CD160]MDI0266960.1 peptidoglycan bridge formation glycyltransferase FemA/FemB family protein [Clostridioides difficile]MDI7818480.1 peptidoglycan bridge formation glycyltransferase FemA/FemB family protein [Clostridioides difficile]
MDNICIKQFENYFQEDWDYFVENKSINGTFLQTRNFINYHKEGKFYDHSLMIYKGKEIIAVIPACEVYENNEKIFFSHLGSTFGGILIGSSFNDIKHVKAITSILEEYLYKKNFNKILLRNTSKIFCKADTSLLEYFLFKNDYMFYDELSMFLELNKYKENILKNFSYSKRRDFKYSLKNNLTFKRLYDDKDVISFFELLSNCLDRKSAKLIHSIEELLDFKNNRLKDIVEFYAVYIDDIMICGSMVFNFQDKVYHTQYLASDSAYNKYYPMIFLNYNLIKNASDRNFKYLSFGISTLNKGKYLDEGLAIFKEGFGSSGVCNRTYYKNINK